MTRAWLRCRSALLAALVLGTTCTGAADEPADEKARAAEFLKLAETRGGGVHVTLQDPRCVFRAPPRADPEVVQSHRRIDLTAGSTSGPTMAGRRPWPRSTSGIPRSGTGPTSSSRSRPPRSPWSETAMPVWTPSRPGVELKTLPDAPAPAGSPAQRLRQMRELATRASPPARPIERAGRTRHAAAGPAGLSL